MSPDYLLAHNRLGMEYDAAGDFESALAEFTEITRLDPNGVLGFANLAVEFCRMHRFPEAQAAGRHALATDPSNEHAHFVLGLALLMGGGSEREARSHLHTASRSIPEATEALAMLDAPR